MSSSSSSVCRRPSPADVTMIDLEQEHEQHAQENKEQAQALTTTSRTIRRMGTISTSSTAIPQRLRFSPDTKGSCHGSSIKKMNNPRRGDPVLVQHGTTTYSAHLMVSDEGDDDGAVLTSKDNDNDNEYCCIQWESRKGCLEWVHASAITYIMKERPKRRNRTNTRAIVETLPVVAVVPPKNKKSNRPLESSKPTNVVLDVETPTTPIQRTIRSSSNSNSSVRPGWYKQQHAPPPPHESSSSLSSSSCYWNHTTNTTGGSASKVLNLEIIGEDPVIVSNKGMDLFDFGRCSDTNANTTNTGGSSSSSSSSRKVTDLEILGDPVSKGTDLEIRIGDGDGEHLCTNEDRDTIMDLFDFGFSDTNNNDTGETTPSPRIALRRLANNTNNRRTQKARTSALSSSSSSIIRKKKTNDASMVVPNRDAPLGVSSSNDDDDETSSEASLQNDDIWDSSDDGNDNGNAALASYYPRKQLANSNNKNNSRTQKAGSSSSPSSIIRKKKTNDVSLVPNRAAPLGFLDTSSDDDDDSSEASLRNDDSWDSSDDGNDDGNTALASYYSRKRRTTTTTTTTTSSKESSSKVIDLEIVDDGNTYTFRKQQYSVSEKNDYRNDNKTSRRRANRKRRLTRNHSRNAAKGCSLQSSSIKKTIPNRNETLGYSSSSDETVEAPSIQQNDDLFDVSDNGNNNIDDDDDETVASSSSRKQERPKLFTSTVIGENTFVSRVLIDLLVEYGDSEEEDKQVSKKVASLQEKCRQSASLMEQSLGSFSDDDDDDDEGSDSSSSDDDDWMDVEPTLKRKNPARHSHPSRNNRLSAPTTLVGTIFPM